MTGIALLPADAAVFDTSLRGASRQPGPAAGEDFDLILEGFGEESPSPHDEECTKTTPDAAHAEAKPENRPDMFSLLLCLPPVEMQTEAGLTPPPIPTEWASPHKATHQSENDSALSVRFVPVLRDGFWLASAPAAAGTPELRLADVAVEPQIAGGSICSESAGHEEQRRPEKTAIADGAVERPSEIDTLLPAPAHPDSSPTSVPSPALQILQQIERSLTAQTGQASSPTSIQQLHLADPPAAPPAELKSLRFMLQPENLGDVEVRLRRSGLETKVTITVTGKVAAETLSRDMSILEDRLGALLAAGPGGAVNVSLEIRELEQPESQHIQNGEEQGSSNEALPGGRGFAQDGRSGANSHPSPVRLSKEEPNVEDPSTGLAVGAGRVV